MSPNISSFFSSSKKSILAGALLACIGGFQSLASAASLIWDVGGTSGAQDGAGTWKNGDSTWWNGSINVPWTNANADTAVFGNGGSFTGATTVLVDGTVNAGGITFAALTAGSTYVYTLGGTGTIALTDGAKIEVTDNASNTGSTQRIIVNTAISGNNITVAKNTGTLLGLITFSGTNTWTGTLTLDGGLATNGGNFVQANNTASLNSLDNVKVLVNSSMVLAGAGTYTKQFNLSSFGAGGRGAIRFDAAADVSGPVILESNSSITVNGSAIGTVSGVISETGGARTLSVGAQGSGSPTLILKGNNTFTGGLNIDGGEVKLDNAGALNATGTNVVTFTNNTINKTLTLNGQSVTVAGLIGGSGTGSVTTQNNSATAATLTVNNAASNTYSGILANGAAAGALSLTKNGIGDLILSGANTYTGLTTINSGTVNIQNNTALGAAGGAGTVITSTTSRLQLQNNITVTGESLETPLLQNVSGNNTWTGTVQSIIGAQLTFSSTAGNLLVSGNVNGKDSANTDHTINLRGAGSGEISGIISNAFTFSKADAGTWILSGENTYSTATSHSGGNLQVGKAGAGRTGSGAVSVAGASTILSGSGRVMGITTLTGGTIRAGDNGGADVGTLSFNNGLTFNAATGSTVAEFTLLNGGVGDKLDVSGNFTLLADNKFTVSFGSGYTLTSGESWDLIDWTGTLATPGGYNIASSLTLPDLSLLSNYSGQTWLISNFSGSGSLRVSIVPEPSRMLLVFSAFSAFAFRRRRV